MPEPLGPGLTARFCIGKGLERLVPHGNKPFNLRGKKAILRIGASGGIREGQGSGGHDKGLEEIGSDGVFCNKKAGFAS